MADTYLSDYLEKAILNHVLRNTAYTPAATVYCRLATSTATQDELHAGTLTNEVTGGSYTGKAMAFNAAAVSSNGHRIISNGNVDFPNMPACTARYAFISDAATAGNVLAVCQLVSDVVLAAGDTLRIANTDLIIQLDLNATALTALGSQMSTYLQGKILNLVFRNTAYTSPATVYLGIANNLATGAELEAGTLTNEITAYANATRPVATWGTPSSGTNIATTAGPGTAAIFTVMPASTVLWTFASDSGTKSAGSILYWQRANDTAAAPAWDATDAITISAGATLDFSGGGSVNNITINQR